MMRITTVRHGVVDAQALEKPAFAPRVRTRLH
jgi:hypothetical protein